jgi:hypothetical protein
VLFAPLRFDIGNPLPRTRTLEEWQASKFQVGNLFFRAVEDVAKKTGAKFFVSEPELSSNQLQRDGCHLNKTGHALWVQNLSFQYAFDLPYGDKIFGNPVNAQAQALLATIIAKNKLWFDYWRPQNWAFLAGDRINQPSSRDWRDPSIRWFPPEREAFLPLIEAREMEIDALATKLSKP